jgi:hypothetical protein
MDLPVTSKFEGNIGRFLSMEGYTKIEERLVILWSAELQKNKGLPKLTAQP